MKLWADLMVLAGGLFAGGAATFAWSRVPIWRGMSPSHFVDDFSETIRRTDKVQPALLVVAIATAVAFAATAEGPGRPLALLGAAGFLVILILSVAVLVPLQRRIVACEQPEAIEDMRRRWFRGHLGRATLAVVAFAVTAIASTSG